MQRSMTLRVAHIDLGPSHQQQLDGLDIDLLGSQMQSRTVVKVVVRVVEWNFGKSLQQFPSGDLAIIQFINGFDCHGRFVQ